MCKAWLLWLGLLLLPGCGTTAVSETADSTWQMGKRFRPGKAKRSSSPSQTSGNNSTATPSKPTPLSQRTASPSYKLGESDGGPGQWEKAPARPKGASYHQEVTGAPEGMEYAVPARTPSGKVLFDGYKDGKLLDAKDWEKWPPENFDFWRQGVLDEAFKQLGAARGTPIEWHFPSEDKARVVRELLDDNDIQQIAVKVSRKK